MRQTLAYITAVLATAFLFCACEDETDFSSDSTLQLSYSTDTLQFEPLLTEQATSTRTIMVYNHSGEDLKISNVELHSASNSFQMNVDGRNGTMVDDLEIRDGDSLYIFVRANLPENADNQPVLIEDSIVINYNGKSDRIILSATGQNAVVLRNYTVLHDTTWTKAQPFLIYDSLKVAEGATLTIKAGTRIYLHKGASFTVDGSLDVRGNASDMVLFSGDRLDGISDISYTQLSDQWEGIRFTESSTGNIVEGAEIRSSNFGIVVDSSAVDSTKWRLVIANSAIHTASQGVLTANNARIKVYNSLLANGGYSNVTLNGGDYLFNFCTISNLSSSVGHSPLEIQGTEEQPVTAANFNSCIIDGAGSNCIGVGEEEWNQYAISYSVVKNLEQDTIHCTNCYWEKVYDSTYVSTKRYEYDFHITPNSVFRHIGETDLLERYPECAIDLDGNPRDNGEQPDAGAYAFFSVETKE